MIKIHKTSKTQIDCFIVLFICAISRNKRFDIGETVYRLPSTRYSSDLHHRWQWIHTLKHWKISTHNTKHY